MKLALRLVAALAVLFLYLLFWPVPIEPRVWQPPLAPPEEAYPYNDRLKGIERLARHAGRGPEGIALDAQGRLYAGYDDGRVMRFDGDGKHGELLANTGGRPLGISVGGKGLFVADADKGLLQIGARGDIRVLSTAADGIPFKLTDDVAQSDADPMLYFTDASARFGLRRLTADLLEHGDSGRVLRYDPATGETKTLIRGLHFANGIALGPGAAYLLVSETAEYRIWRYWLKGDRAGRKEVFIDNLPGFPDNLSIDDQEHVWLALYAPRDRTLDRLAARPALRKIAYRLLSFLRPKPERRSWVLVIDRDGKIARDAQYRGAPQNPKAALPYGPVTSVVQFGPMVYFGSLEETAIGRLTILASLPSPTAAQP
ncbi:MAG: SMP-30/gluconolactonase/LRE family protein [Solimonas sp.]